MTRLKNNKSKRKVGGALSSVPGMTQMLNHII